MMAQMKERVTTYHLEINTPADHEPAGAPRTAYQLIKVEIPIPQLNRFLYAAVGADWYWYERLSWSFSRWQAYLSQEEVETWVAYVQGAPAGYFELERQPPDSVEIAYFGLLPQFIGRGMGAALLSDAIRTAAAMGSVEGNRVADGNRVWVHSCTLDHPAALNNYRARGFKVFDTVEAIEELPDESLEAWPGAGSID
jgi:ribosomal protein S18 acetylase RimI-like enzyme